jgi:membrane-bound lytic murein transglycosylase A
VNKPPRHQATLRKRPPAPQSLATLLKAGVLGLALLATGCATKPPAAVSEVPEPVNATTLACPKPAACPVCAACPGVLPEKPKVETLEAVGFDAISGWRNDKLNEAWGAFRASCQALRQRPGWRETCAQADELSGTEAAAPAEARVREFFERNFTPYRVANPDGSTQGMVTGYYEPLLRGSRVKRPPYVHALYAPPEDLLTIDLSAINPDLKNMRLRGRVEGRRVVPYWSRDEIERGIAPVAGREIVWVNDPVELFFLQIQGSGRVQFDNGEMMRVGYADQNGHPYQSVGRYLIDKGELKLEQASMQGIKAWGRANPTKLEAALNHNASYVFFRELPARPGGAGFASDGPLGALGVPLTDGRSIAVDPRSIPLGAPVFLATTQPNSTTPLTRLMMAQDTGGAIRGAVRADFFWGFGAEAGNLAGRMRQQGQMWVLLPRGVGADAAAARSNP